MKFPSPFYRWRPHPWHGLEVGPNPPDVVNAFIEITPFDLMKYEVDKVSGCLRVDRPQRSSAQHPALYGFVLRTYCADRVCRLAPGAKRGDGDPLDICVLSERAITRSEIIVTARVIGGLQMIDAGEADDKIIGVLDKLRAGASRVPLYSIVFHCRMVGGDLRPHPLECADVGWFAEDSLPVPLAGAERWGPHAFSAIRGERVTVLFDEPRVRPWLEEAGDAGE